jgi:hypothetical protein
MMKSALIALLTLVPLAVWAAPNLNEKITLKMKNVTADLVFGGIQQQHNVQFKIDPKIKFKKPLSIDVKEAKLKDVLNFIVAEQRVKWTAADGNTIKITPAK